MTLIGNYSGYESLPPLFERASFYREDMDSMMCDRTTESTNTSTGEDWSDLDDPFLNEETPPAVDDYLRFMNGELSYELLLQHPLKESIFNRAVRRSLVVGNDEFFERLKSSNIRLDCPEMGGNNSYLTQKLIWKCIWRQDTVQDPEFEGNFLATLDRYHERGGSLYDNGGQSVIYTLIKFRFAPADPLCLLRFFVERGFEFHHTNEESKNVLHLICRDYQPAYLDVFDYFKRLGGDLNAVDHKGFTPLHYLINNPYQCIETKRNHIAVLIQHGASVAKEAGFQSSALLLSLSESRSAGYNRSQEKSKHNFIIFNDIKKYCVQIDWGESCQKGYPLWRYVLTSGITNNILEMIKQLPTYFLISSKGDVFLQLLMNHFQLPNDEAFLMECCVDILSQPGSDAILNQYDANRLFPLDYAISYGFNELAKLFIRKGASLNHNAYLHSAIELNNLEVVEELLENRADVNEQDRLGNTPLHQAILHYQTEIAKALIKKTPDWTIRNHQGFTPYNLLVQRGQITMYRALFNSSPKDLVNIFCEPLFNNGQFPLDQLDKYFIYSDFRDMRDLFLEMLVQYEPRIPCLRETLVSKLKEFCTWGCLIVRTGGILEEEEVKSMYHSSQDDYVARQIAFGKSCWGVVQAAKSKMDKQFQSFREILKFFSQERFKLVSPHDPNAQRFLKKRIEYIQGPFVTPFGRRYLPHLSFVHSIIRRLDSAPIKNIVKMSGQNAYASNEENGSNYTACPLAYQVTFEPPGSNRIIELSRIVCIQEVSGGKISPVPMWCMEHSKDMSDLKARESLKTLDQLVTDRHEKIFKSKWGPEQLQAFHSLLTETYALLSHYTPLSRGSAQCSLMWRLLVLSYHDVPSVPLKLEVGMSDVRAIMQTVEGFQNEVDSGLVYDYANLIPNPEWNLDRYCRELLLVSSKQDLTSRE